ncbi:MAG: hypothetical protein ABSG56_28375 [Bryobacteraceae bacterium]|jgi:hypothetical protein
MKPNQQDCLTCPKCGSTNFSEDEFRQYTVHASALPGGGLSPSNESRHVKICMCGHPMPVGALARFDEVGKGFQESLDLAWQHLEKRNPDKILAELARDFVTRREFNELTGRLDGLQAILGQARGKDTDQPVPG